MLILYSCIDNENLNRLVIYNLEKEKEKAEKEKVVAVREKEVAALKAQVDEITKKFNTLVPRSIIGISFTLRCIISPYSI
jgi:hypothetical protein